MVKALQTVLFTQYANPQHRVTTIWVKLCLIMSTNCNIIANFAIDIEIL